MAWSPCSKFIACIRTSSTEVEILDAKTLGRIKTFTSPSSNIQWLGFSPDGRLLTGFSKELDLTNWDTQSGLLASAISSESHTAKGGCFSSLHSTDGKIVAVAWGNSHYPYPPTFTAISTYDLVSKRYLYSHRTSEGRIVAPIWTHDERLRFATVKPSHITVWEVGFTSLNTLTEVETLPAPDKIDGAAEVLFLPTLSRLAFVLSSRVLIWDAHHSRLLLDWKGKSPHPKIDSPPDGQLFACAAWGKGIIIWKESPTGYILHRELASSRASTFRPHFSPNGELIIAHHLSVIELWYSEDPTLSFSSDPCGSAGPSGTSFVFGLAPDETFAAVAQLRHGTITILDLKSGKPRLTIDTGMKTHSLRVARRSIGAGTEILPLMVVGRADAAVGEERAVVWNVPAGDRVLTLGMNVNDSVQTTKLDCVERSWYPPGPHTSVSPDFNRIAIAEGSSETPYYGLNIYDVTTGKRLAATTPCAGRLGMPWFTPDSREVWWVVDGHERGWTIVEDEKSSLTELSPIGPDALPSGGFPWQSSRGYKVTPDGWVLSPSGKRLLWLPHSWRWDEKDRAACIWEGRFLGLLHDTLPEAVILELYE